MASAMFWIGLLLFGVAIGRGIRALIGMLGAATVEAPSASGGDDGTPTGAICLLVGGVLIIVSFFVPTAPTAHATLVWLIA